jgi:hypothetical protein
MKFGVNNPKKLSARRGQLIKERAQSPLLRQSFPQIESATRRREELMAAGDA